MSEELLSELFMFEFVLRSKMEMADIFWQRCPNQMVTALVMSAFLERKSEKQMELRKKNYATDLMKMSRILDQRATFILDKMRIIDEVDEAQLDVETHEEFGTEDRSNYDENFQILKEPVIVMGFTITPLDFAFDNERLDFLAHSACIQYLYSVWSGGYEKVKGPGRNVIKVVTSPRTNFWISYFFFLAAMVCISVFVLTDVRFLTSFNDVSYYQMAFTVWIVGDFLEEILVTREKRWKAGKRVGKLSRLQRIKNWFFDFWNLFDIFCYLSYTSGVIVHSLTTDPTATIPLRLYSLTTVLMYARFMRVLLIWKEIGTKVIMIGYMVIDLLRFLSILSIVLFGVGVAYHALIYPNSSRTPILSNFWDYNWTDARIYNIIGIPYWQIYGDPQLDILRSEAIAYCKAQDILTDSDCDARGIDFAATLIAFMYILFGNALLLNVVIAMFSHRYESTEMNSEKMYNYRLTFLILEYQTRLPSPMNLLIRPFKILFKLLYRLRTIVLKPTRLRKIGVLERTKMFSVETPFSAEKHFPATENIIRTEHKYTNVTPSGVDETTTSFQFEVKSGEHVFVRLFAYPTYKHEGEMTQVMIRVSDKENSIITNIKKDVLVIKDTKEILHKSKYRAFKIEWRKFKGQNGKVTDIAVFAGTDDGKYDLKMEASIPTKININHIAIYTSSKSEGSWKFVSASKDNITKKRTKKGNGFRFAEYIDIEDGSNSVLKDGSFSVLFEVRAKYDAHLVLFEKPEGTSKTLHELTQNDFEMIKVILGGHDNQKSWITYTNYTQIQNVDKVDRRLVKDPRENRYWISWGEMENEKKIIKVGTGTEVDMNILMKGLLDPFRVYSIGVSTSDQRRGRLNINPGKTIFTPFEFNYQLVTPITMISTYKAFTFAVKAESDAHIALCKKIPGTCGGDMYEIGIGVIGTQGNIISYIRNIHVSPDYLHSHEGNMLNSDKYKNFWISWDDGRIMVGEGDYCMKNNSFLDYRYKDYTVRYIAVSTGPNSKGYWRFKDEHLYIEEAKWEKTQLKWKRSQDLWASVSIHGNDKNTSKLSDCKTDTA